MEPLEFFNWLVQQEWYKVITSLVTTCSILAAVTPNQYDNLAAKWLRWFVDLVAINVANAKNQKK